MFGPRIRGYVGREKVKTYLQCDLAVSQANMKKPSLTSEMDVFDGWAFGFGGGVSVMITDDISLDLGATKTYFKYRVVGSETDKYSKDSFGVSLGFSFYL